MAQRQLPGVPAAGGRVNRSRGGPPPLWVDERDLRAEEDGAGAGEDLLEGGAIERAFDGEGRAGGDLEAPATVEADGLRTPGPGVITQGSVVASSLSV